jgi:hypothetical protein
MTGLDAEGLDAEGLDAEGLDAEGLDAEGLDGVLWQWLFSARRSRLSDALCCPTL